MKQPDHDSEWAYNFSPIEKTPYQKRCGLLAGLLLLGAVLGLWIVTR